MKQTGTGGLALDYDIHIIIPEDSSGGHLIASLTASQHITPTQAVEKLINQVAQQQNKSSLAADVQENPVELVERLRKHKKSQGLSSRPPKNPEGSYLLMGMLAGNQEFSQTMDEIIHERTKRYGFKE